MAEGAADTVVMLSSELISKITEEYFNKTMFKQKVKIVDSRPTETGYLFSIDFVAKVEKEAVDREERLSSTTGDESVHNPFRQGIVLEKTRMVRATNGRFQKVSQ